MKADELPQVAERLGMLWPTQEVSQRYLDGLVMSVGAYPVEDVLRALHELSTGDTDGRPREFLPPPGVVTSKVVEIRTHDALVGRSLSMGRSMLPPEPEPEQRKRGRRSLELLREILDRARTGSRMSEDEIGAEIRRLDLSADLRDELVSCPECRDIGFVGCRDGGLAPCPRCRRETNDLWRGGHYLPNHSCAACEDRKRGRRRVG